MKLLLGLTLVTGAFAQANPETFFYSDNEEPSKYVGLVTKDPLGAFPVDGSSITPYEGYAYDDFNNWVAEIAPDGTVTVLALYDTEFFGLFLGVEIGVDGAFEGGNYVDVSGFINSDPDSFTDADYELPPFIAYDGSGRLWTGDYTDCYNGETAATQVWWGTIDYTADPAVFTGLFQVGAPPPDVAYYSPVDDYYYYCPWYSGYQDIGFSVLGNYLYLEFDMYWSGIGVWAISLDTQGLYQRTLENMIWATWYYGFGNDVSPNAAVDRGQGVFFVASYDSTILDTGIWLEYYDFSCDPAAIVRFDPTPIVYDDTNGDQEWEKPPVAAGREFYYCNWPAGVCEDGVINENFVVIGDGLVESECASVPTGTCGYTWIGCADGYVAHGFIEGRETCNRTASEIGWSTTSWSVSTDTFECEFGAGGASTECFEKCTEVAKSVDYRGDELQFEVTCFRCDDPLVDLERRQNRITPVTDTTGFGAVVVAVGCDVGDVDCCNFVLSRAQCEAGVELDLCFCGVDDIDCPDPNCNESKKGLLGLLGLLGLIPLALCCLLLLLCLLRRKKAGAPVPVATFDACAPPVLDAGLCTAPTFGSVGAPVGYPGTFCP